MTAVHAGMDQFGVLVFHDQPINDDQQLVFSRSLGPLEQATGDIAAPQDRRMSMDLNDISNLDKHNKVLARDDRRRLFGLGNQLWHSDSSFKPVPAKYSLLSARTIPPTGGNTEFADMRAAYDALPEEVKQRLRGLVAEHAIMYSRKKLGFTDFSDEENQTLPPVPQVLVRRHAGSGRKGLYLASHAGRIFGMSAEEGDALLQQLIEHATQRQFVYAHRWRVHDLVMWDNRCTMHRGKGYDDLRWPRDMQRATVSDVAPTCEQEGIEVPAAA